jgi:hypothetical protein
VTEAEAERSGAPVQAAETKTVGARGRSTSLELAGALLGRVYPANAGPHWGSFSSKNDCRCRDGLSCRSYAFSWRCAMQLMIENFPGKIPLKSSPPANLPKVLLVSSATFGRSGGR